MAKKHLTKAKNGVLAATKKFKAELKKAMVTAITAAFGFLIAFMWRDAISQYVKGTLARLNLPETSAFYSVIAAIAVTILCVLGLLIISRWASKPEK